MNYSASNLPPGAGFNPKLRLFYWKPSVTQAGIYNVIFKATDREGLSDSKTARITVNKTPSCVVSGTVYVANGSIDTIKVELLKDNIMLIDTRHVPANGRYSFTQDIPVGTYKLKAAAPWGEVQEKTVSFTTQGESKTVDFNLTMPLPVAE